MEEITQEEASRGWSIFTGMVSKAVQGAGGCAGSRALAARYLAKCDFDPDEAARKLVRRESLNCGLLGFTTGFGGLIALPVSIPADVLGSLMIQARMVGAVAHVYGHDAANEETMTLIGLCMLGGQGANAVKDGLGRVGEQMTVRAIKAIPREALTKINQAIGMRFVTKFGTTGVVNLGRAVPFVGSGVMGALDYGLSRGVGKIALRLLAGVEEPDHETYYGENGEGLHFFAAAGVDLDRLPEELN